MDQLNQKTISGDAKKRTKASKRRWTEVMSGFSPQMISHETGAQPCKNKPIGRQLSCPNQARNNDVNARNIASTSDGNKLVKLKNFSSNDKKMDGNAQFEDKRVSVDTIYALLFGEESVDDVTEAVETSITDVTQNDVMHMTKASTFASEPLSNIASKPSNGVSVGQDYQDTTVDENRPKNRKETGVASAVREPEANVTSCSSTR